MTTSLTKLAKNEHERMKLNCGLPFNYLEASFADFKSSAALKFKVTKAIDDGRGVYIYGKNGSGKTHLLSAMMHRIYETEFFNKQTAIFLDAPSMLLRIKDTFKSGSEYSTVDIVEKYSTIKYFFLDDLGAEQTTDFSSEALFIILNNRISNSKAGLQTFITSNYSLEQLDSQHSERISSRVIRHCEVIKLNLQDYYAKK